MILTEKSFLLKVTSFKKSLISHLQNMFSFILSLGIRLLFLMQMDLQKNRIILTL